MAALEATAATLAIWSIIGPFVGELAKGMAQGTGEKTAAGLLEWLRKRMTSEADTEAIEDLMESPDDLDLQGAFRARVKRLLRDDQVLEEACVRFDLSNVSHSNIANVIGDQAIVAQGNIVNVNSMQEAPTRTVELSDFDLSLFMEYCRPRNQQCVSFANFDSICTRESERARDTIDLLLMAEFMRPTENGTAVITTKGHEFGDQLWNMRIAHSLGQKAGEYVSESKIAKQVVLTDGDSEMAELRRLLNLLDEMGHIDLCKTSHGYSARLLPAGQTYVKHHKTELLVQPIEVYIKLSE